MPISLGDHSYPRIGDHGVIGDQRTAALVAVDGTIDFWCTPEFDSPTVFAALLDASRGGQFTVAPADAMAASQRYVRDSNVLITRFTAESAVLETADFMPLERPSAPSRIVRLVTVRGAPTRVHLRCAPRFDYARIGHSITLDGDTAEFCSVRGQRLRLTSTAPLGIDGEDIVAAPIVTPDEPAAFVLESGAVGERPRWNAWHARRAMRQTIVHWRRWTSGCAYRGPWRDAVRRSALTLALLHSRRTGAVVAAPTFGLPERIGGPRNWDFRYCWIRDAAFTIFALSRLGLRLQGTPFAAWIEERCAEAAPPTELQSVYGIDGRRQLTEQILDHFEGYRASRPVRIGNAAYEQLQLDIYGELLDALYVEDERHASASRALWDRIVVLVDWLCANWPRRDHGIWEVRSGAHEFLYSRVMCWVAVDRALRLARRRRWPATADYWRATREAIRRDIDAHFWSSELGAYVGSKRSNAMDAACLVMPLVGFIEPTDPRWLATLARIEERLVRDGLVRRYDLSDMDTDAGAVTAPAFTICSFWYVECLARAGRHDDAEQALARLLSRANHLGLYSEDLGPDGALLGNFPQGWTHAALIGAALALTNRPASARESIA